MFQEKHKTKKRRPVIGCFPLYPPLELFHSMNMTPVVLWGLAEKYDKTIHADRYIQTFCCGIARKMIEYILSDGPKEFDLLFMYNACDTLRNLPEIIESGLDDDSLPLLRMHIPAARLDSDYGRNYLQYEIGQLVEFHEERTDTPFNLKAFRDSVSLYRSLRKKVNVLGEHVADGRIGYADETRLLLEQNTQPVEEQIHALDETIASISGNDKSDGGKRIIVSGILPPPLYACEAMDRAGLRVVVDDTAMVGRSVGYTPESFDTVEDYYHQFYMNHTPCSTLLHTAERRLETLLDLARQYDALGLIFIGEKYCEYEYFDFPDLDEVLRRKGIKTLQLEFDMGDTQSGSVQTRIEAFAEMLENSP